MEGGCSQLRVPSFFVMDDGAWNGKWRFWRRRVMHILMRGEAFCDAK